jgi:hypothetical protein
MYNVFARFNVAMDWMKKTGNDVMGPGEEEASSIRG